jgi:PAS domain S-box-containing protein
VQSQASVERDASGQPLRMVGLVRDITAQKHAEARLRQSEATLRNITETIDDVFWLIEIGHPESMYVSPGFAKLYGRPCASRAADAAGWLVSVHAEDRDRMARLFGRLADGEGYAAEYRILRPDGEERWVMERARRVASLPAKTTSFSSPG